MKKETNNYKKGATEHRGYVFVMAIIDWTDTEMAIALGFYMFDAHPAKRKRHRDLAKKLSTFTGIERSEGSVRKRMGNFLSVDPNYTKKGYRNGGAKVEECWNEYITNDPGLHKLATIYSNFINGRPIGDLSKNTTSVASSKTNKTKVVATIVYNRSEKVKDATLLRAGGKCELCSNNAPFLDKDGNPFLEVHHFVPLSEGGPDTTSNTLALCPNCHRKLHYGSALKKSETKRLEEIMSKVI